MLEPRVIELQYAIIGSQMASEAPPLAFVHRHGVFQLHGRLLRVRPQEPWRTVGEAAAAIEQALRSWTLETELAEGTPAFGFRLDSAEVINGTGFSSGRPAVDALVTNGEIVFERLSFPDPPRADFDDELITALARVKKAEHRFGFGEPLQGAAYYFLTLVEKRAGGRREALNRYRIEKPVLAKLGELTSTRGDSTTVR